MHSGINDEEARRAESGPECLDPALRVYRLDSRC